MMYQAILLDLDGTLLDTTEGVIYAVRRTIETLQLDQLSESILSTFVGPPMQLSFEKHYGMDKETSLKAANLFRKIYKEESLYKAKLYPNVLETLCYLKHQGYKIAVATNKSHNNAMDILNYFGIMTYCDYAMGSDLEGILKKDDIILECCNQMGCEPEKCVYVGDSEFDLEGAKKCGMDFIAVTYGFGFKNFEFLAKMKKSNSFEDIRFIIKED